LALLIDRTKISKTRKPWLNELPIDIIKRRAIPWEEGIWGVQGEGAEGTEGSGGNCFIPRIQTSKNKNIQQQGFAGGHPPNY
jgi:hypothetical protein